MSNIPKSEEKDWEALAQFGISMDTNLVQGTARIARRLLELEDKVEKLSNDRTE